MLSNIQSWHAGVAQPKLSIPPCFTGNCGGGSGSLPVPWDKVCVCPSHDGKIDSALIYLYWLLEPSFYSITCNDHDVCELCVSLDGSRLDKQISKVSHFGL